MNQKVMASPIGRLLLVSSDGMLTRVCLLPDEEAQFCRDTDDPVLLRAQQQLEQYFVGERKEFDLPLAVHGTAFERAVWQQMAQIPFGQICSYGALAAGLGNPSACRAVGGACSRNPLLIVLPCHRVIASSGKLTGFAAGMAAKRTLLALEGWEICADRIKEMKRE